MTSAGGFNKMSMKYYGPKEGVEPTDLAIGPFDIADNARTWYWTFHECRDADKVRPDARFQVTIPGPGTTGVPLDLLSEELFRVPTRALRVEIDRIVAAIPTTEPAIHFDLTAELEVEEYRRRPDAFDLPLYEDVDWMTERTAAWTTTLGDAVPAAVELGFHLCSIWHMYPYSSQDNAAPVDYANMLSSCLTRKVDYVHIPTVPGHTAADIAPLNDLELGPDTTLFLGVIHRVDGIEGAKRRLEAASRPVSDFGLASFCGLEYYRRANRRRLSRRRCGSIARSPHSNRILHGSAAA